MKVMTPDELRASFLEFFGKRGHTVVASSSLLPDSPNLLFTNAGMNQFVPIFLGQTGCPYDPPRAADTQKCIRAGGKHNDLEDVGLDTYHHTFFEMLGNWSFGDYFKREAIEWAWELLVEVWKFPPERLYATVYEPGPGEPGEADEEARGIWEGIFRGAGLDPRVHVVGGGKRDNFWMMGETGPCGPCSEVHIDLTPQGGTRGALVNKGTPECIEIWNLVFIQFNAGPDGGLSALPARHVDTGMGFERVAGIVACTRGLREFGRVVSNYDTALFLPLFEKIGRLSGQVYGGVFPGEGGLAQAGREAVRDTAFRVIADHARAVAFAVADGIEPGNTGRHYVLRRILRRAVRAGRTLGLREPFLWQLVEVLDGVMGDVFPEIRRRRAEVEDVVRQEEEAFHRTLEKGLALFEEEMGRLGGEGCAGARVLGGEAAFKLYDTYGFPLDLTQVMARERGVEVDVAGFEALMERQRARARAARKVEVIEVADLEGLPETEFVGYDALVAEARVEEVLEWKGALVAVCDRSPLYAEMGGQLGDTGVMEQGGRMWRIAPARKAGGVWLHVLEEGAGEAPEKGGTVVLRCDKARRRALERHHTATHLLHWALHEVCGGGVMQKGSLVAPEKLTFDFNSAPLSEGQLRDIERLVNERIFENEPVSWVEVPYAEVKGRQDVQQFFGEKYGERVRVVQIGGRAGGLDGFSMELCGGTHVRAAGEVGLFRIVGESAVAAGIRRIEAVAGWAAWERARGDAERLGKVAELAGAPLPDLEKKLEGLKARVKELEKELEKARQREAAVLAQSLLALRKEIGGVPVIFAEAEAAAEELAAVAGVLKGRFDGVVGLFGVKEGRVSLVFQTGPGWQGKFPAGKLLQAVAGLVGGKGGGKADLARGAGTEPGGVAAALARCEELVAGGGV